MSLDREAELSAAETDEVLSRHETGVLALARADEPYAIPISYGYDRNERVFYLRLVSTPDSEKRAYLESSPRSRLVVYEAADPVYRSVVATGTLAEVPRSELTVDHVEQFGTAKRPLFEMWGESKPDLNVQLYRFDPEEINGRRIEIDRDESE